MLSAIVGQKVHIFTEDPLHFEAFCDYLITDNGADSRVVEKCVVDNYFFFPCVFVDALHVSFAVTLLAEAISGSTSEKHVAITHPYGLRAPPVRG